MNNFCFKNLPIRKKMCSTRKKIKNNIKNQNINEVKNTRTNNQKLGYNQRKVKQNNKNKPGIIFTSPIIENKFLVIYKCVLNSDRKILF